MPRTQMPGFIKPQLATLKMKAPSGEAWIHEIKYDGYRVQIHLDRGKVKVFTRNGHDWTNRFSAIAKAFDLKSQSIFDGEVVVVHEGRTNFLRTPGRPCLRPPRTGWSSMPSISCFTMERIFEGNPSSTARSV